MRFALPPSPRDKERMERMNQMFLASMAKREEAEAAKQMASADNRRKMQ